METLYIYQERCRIHRESEHLKLTQSGKVLSTIPLFGVKTLVLFDSISLTTPAMDLLLHKGIDIIYQSKWGKIKGRILSAKSGGAITRLAQHTAFFNMEEFRTPFVDAWVLAILNKKQLKAEHFHIPNGDWRLTDEGFHKFCTLYHKWVSPWRSKFGEQANKLKAALMEGKAYEPYHE